MTQPTVGQQKDHIATIIHNLDGLAHWNRYQSFPGKIQTRLKNAQLLPEYEKIVGKSLKNWDQGNNLIFSGLFGSIFDPI